MGLHTTHLLLVKIGVPPPQLVEHITREILEPILGQRREFLSRLVPLWVEVFSNCQEWFCRQTVCSSDSRRIMLRTVITRSVLDPSAPRKFIVHVRRQLLELQLSQASQLFPGRRPRRRRFCRQ
jgi:hypothetical protein